MRRRLSAIAILLLAAAASPALSRGEPKPAPPAPAAVPSDEGDSGEPATAFDLRDPRSFAETVRDLGYRARIGRTDDGAPKIESRAARADFVMIFGACTKRRDCGHVLLIASWDLEGKTDPLPAVNEWNNEKKYGRAWYDPDTDAIGIDVTWDLVGSVTRDTLDDQLTWWSDTLEAYQTFLGDKFGSDSITEKSDGSSRDI